MHTTMGATVPRAMSDQNEAVDGLEWINFYDEINFAGTPAFNRSSGARRGIKANENQFIR